MSIGFILSKGRLITVEGSRSLANILLYVSLPCVIFRAFVQGNPAEKIPELGICLAVSLALLTLSIIVAQFLFRNNPIDHVGVAFSNAGFIGVPLVNAFLGSEAVFYTAGFIALLNVLQWTYGQQVLLHGEKKTNLRQLINPLTISFLVGLVVLFGNIHIPYVLSQCISGFAQLNSPIAMTVLGTYLAQSKIGEMFSQINNYRICFVRLLLIPFLSILLLCFLPKEMRQMKQSLLLVAAAPVGPNVAVYAQKLGKDYTHAVQIVCLSTLCCITTIILMIWLSGILWC